jgi:hypothetical protein
VQTKYLNLGNAKKWVTTASQQFKPELAKAKTSVNKFMKYVNHPVRETLWIAVGAYLLGVNIFLGVVFLSTLFFTKP